VSFSLIGIVLVLTRFSSSPWQFTITEPFQSQSIKIAWHVLSPYTAITTTTAVEAAALVAKYYIDAHITQSRAAEPGSSAGINGCNSSGDGETAAG
jgi:hypothetical protein